MFDCLKTKMLFANLPENKSVTDMPLLDAQSMVVPTNQCRW